MINSTFILILFLGFPLLAFSSSTNGGGGSIIGNGGDGIAIEFRNLARSVGQNLMQDSQNNAFDVNNFVDLVEKAEIQTKPRLVLRGQEVDAINYPSLLKIEISRERWLVTGRSISAMVSLVFHEVLGLMNIHDDRIVKVYVDQYIHQFIDRPFESRPRLLLRCENSLSESETKARGLPFVVLGMRNFLLFQQNTEHQVYLEDKLVPRSMRPYDKVSRFLGYFKCHTSPDMTHVVCTDLPCNKVILSWLPKEKLFRTEISVDRILGACKVPETEEGARTENYLKTDLLFPAERCQRATSRP